MLALGDLLDEITGDIDIPVYLADSVLTPTAGEELDKQGKILFMTSVGEFALPRSLVNAAYIDEVANLLEEHVKNDSAPAAFSASLCDKFPLDPKKDAHDIAITEELFVSLRDLERNNINGIWARIIKNAFAPLFQPQFDRVAGNPPWINWEHLPDEYRQRSAWLWTRYQLFEHTGLRARLGSAKDDLSVLMLYVAADQYLKPKGKLGFIITQTIFKTEGGGQGFRRLQLGNGESLKVIQVDDFSEVQCFEGATNRAAVLIVQKGQATQYPVVYNYWRKTVRERIPTEIDHDVAMERLTYFKWVARPINPAKRNSPWITGRRRALSHIENVTGKADYDARAGSCTWLNGVYWVDIVAHRKDGLVLISNLHDCGRTAVKNVNMAVEQDIVFPLLRGRDVGRWKAAPTSSILVPQDPEDPAKGLTEAKMQARFTKALGYFRQFEEQLRKRSGFKQYFDQQTAPFYSIYNVGPYTFQPHKVVWREQASLLTAAVTSVKEGEQPIVPDHKLMLCPGKSEDEVHYLCALLNSLPAQFIVKGYSLETSISTHVFSYVRIGRFDSKDKRHRALARNSEALHQATDVGDTTSIQALEAENVDLAAAYWGLEASEVADMRASLEELA